MHELNNELEDGIDQYLQGKLSADALAEFEVKMLEDPHLFAQVQQAEIMHAALKAERSQFDDQLTRNAPAIILPIRDWIKQPMSLAASILLAVGVLITGGNYLGQSAMEELQQGYALNSVVNLGQLRSGLNETVLTQEPHLLQVDVGIQMTQTIYTARLSNSQGRQFEFQLAPDNNGIVRLLTPSGLSGQYRLTVEARATQEQLASYTLIFE